MEVGGVDGIRAIQGYCYELMSASRSSRSEYSHEYCRNRDLEGQNRAIIHSSFDALACGRGCTVGPLFCAGSRSGGACEDLDVGGDGRDGYLRFAAPAAVRAGFDDEAPIVGIYGCFGQLMLVLSLVSGKLVQIA
jgi:hypothetical protein